MSNDLQSIEDLMAHGKNPDSDRDTVQGKADEKLRDVQLKSLEENVRAQAATDGLPYVNLVGFPISPEALALIPEERSFDLKTICFLNTGPEIRIGSVRPKDPAVEQLLFELSERNKANGKIYTISEQSLVAALKLYTALPKVRKIVKGVQVPPEDLARFQGNIHNTDDIQGLLKQASVSDMLIVVMAGSLQFRSSDIHIEAEKEKVIVRYRIDGVLQEVASLPHEIWKQLSGRIKLISNLKINVTDQPQDGRFTIFVDGGDTDVRVSTIPTTWGESIVMRVLSLGAVRVALPDMGWRPKAAERLKKELQKPHGMILTTGPTGSGKTTTLYAILQALNSPERKIVTLEDPIEYKMEGINQSQIDHTKQYTFANGLRSILRQDPDIVMVGEIRDFETADVAINAALTGHLLLSTLHTNDASGAIPRLISMGVKPFLLGPALNAIIGQRLARKVCEACKETFDPGEEVRVKIRSILSTLSPKSGETVPDESAWRFVRGKGCETCHHTGFKGRIGLYELLFLSETIQQALSDTLSEQQVHQLAVSEGMVTMVQDGVLKLLEGITTPDEVFRVVGDGT